MFVLCSDCTLDSLIQEQFFLARRANINFAESQEMADFERVILVGMLSKDLKEEEAAYSDITK